MYKDFYYKNYASLNEAMRIHNKIMPGEKFNYIDYGLLSLIRSFYDSKKDFYMTNDQLAAMFFVCDKTIRKSINRLCKCQFIKKQYKENNRLKGRYLIYNEKNVNSFVSSMLAESSR